MSALVGHLSAIQRNYDIMQSRWALSDPNPAMAYGVGLTPQPVA